MGNFDCAGVSSGMDRRAFLKLSGLTAGIAALSGTMLAGCSSKEGGENVDDKVGGEASAGIPFSVYESDIVLIGAGFGATFAINEARKAGKSITVLEKAPFGFGGSAGMNFNIMHTWQPGAWYETEDEVPVKLEFQEAYIRDLNLWAKTYVQNEIEVNPEVVCANFGEVHQDRNPDGTPFYIYDFPTTRGFEYSMTRNWCDFIDSKDFVTVHDRTMAVDLIVEDGRCLGIVGLHLPTGEYRVYRANSGSQGGNQNTMNRLMGRYAMKKALEYVDAYKEPADATFASVIEEIARLEDLRTRKIEGSIRPITVRRAIQMACAEAARPARPTAVLEAARDELERILAEDLPKMACADDSRMWNADWKDAIEVINLLDEARLLVAASLEREESRAAFIRPEFPETDNENWFCSLAYTRAADGTLTSEKITF